jgi:hypothetical protein
MRDLALIWMVSTAVLKYCPRDHYNFGSNQDSVFQPSASKLNNMQSRTFFSAPIPRLAFQVGLLLALVPALAWTQGTYTTSFPLTENPISEGGRWINGGTVGLNWTNVATTTGKAFGTESAPPTVDDDSTAILTGTWGCNQTLTATVYATGSVNGEVELRLHTSVAAHSITGYEMNFSVAYSQIVRWNGALNQFTILATQSSTGVKNGDVVKGTIDCSGHLTEYINGVVVNTATDTTYATGSPGIGFFANNPPDSAYGFSQFTATDGTTQNSFTLSSSPASQTVSAGGNAAYTVTVAPSGSFTGAVALSASGQPSGATVSFNPTSITTSGTSTMTVTTTASTGANSYPLTIKGTSGSLSQTALATLVVSPSGGSGTTGTSCDLNTDGSTNVVDVQLAVNKYLSCTSGPNVSSQSFVSQVITGALGGTCSPAAGAHTVMLNWTASQTPGVNYNVYRATTSGGYTTALNASPVAGTAFADCTVSPGLTYYYVIRSVDAGGNLSPNSTEIVVAIPSS